MTQTRKYLSQITNKGQITIPIGLRKDLDISVGNKIELIKHNDYILMLPINNSISQLKASLTQPKIPLSIEEMNNIIKDKVRI